MAQRVFPPYTNSPNSIQNYPTNTDYLHRTQAPMAYRPSPAWTDWPYDAQPLPKTDMPLETQIKPAVHRLSPQHSDKLTPQHRDAIVYLRAPITRYDAQDCTTAQKICI